MIETEDLLETALKEIFEHKEGVIGLDCEFRSSYIPGEDCHADLVQIATSSKIYIIDLMKLTSKQCFNLIKDLMSSHDVIKTGIGFKEDLKGILRRLGEEEMVR